MCTIAVTLMMQLLNIYCSHCDFKPLLYEDTKYFCLEQNWFNCFPHKLVSFVFSSFPQFKFGLFGFLNEDLLIFSYFFLVKCKRNRPSCVETVCIKKAAILKYQSFS